MATLSEMRDRIADDLSNDSLSAQIDVAINRAIDFYSNLDFWFNNDVGSFNTVLGQSIYSTSDGVPSDIILIKILQLVNSSQLFSLRKQTDIALINMLQATSSNSTPTDFCVYNENIYLFPTPNDAYQINVYYKKSYSPLVEDTDTNDFSENAYTLIEARASFWINHRILKDYNSAEAYKIEELQQLEMLKRRTNETSSTGNIMSSRRYNGFY